MANTGYKVSSANSNVLGTVTNPGNAYSSNNLYATFYAACAQNYYNFSFTVPTGATIDGIMVSVEGLCGGTSFNGDQESVYVGLSGDGGSSFTGNKLNVWTMDAGEATYTYGGATDKWGFTWSDTSFSDANFRVKIYVTDNVGGADPFLLDLVMVNVYYTVSSGGIWVSDDSVLFMCGD